MTTPTSPREADALLAEVKALIDRLRQIADHDWRVSFLAHTSDTAAEAARVLARISSALSAPPAHADIVEAAARALSAHLTASEDAWPDYVDDVLPVLAAILPRIEQAATERERERCAKLAVRFDDCGGAFIADAIRATPKDSEGK